MRDYIGISHRRTTGTVPIPMGDAGEAGAMRSGSRSSGGGDRHVETETDSVPTTATPSDAIERQLTEALDATESPQVRFHLRQALQLVECLDE